MNILFLSYWEVDEGLTKATVIPHLKILRQIRSVNKIVFCSIERSKKEVRNIEIDSNILHILLSSGKSYWHKILDFIFLPISLGRLVKANEIDFMICRGALAGSLGHLVNKYYRTPYMVESFEPHAQYMAESAVWNPRGVKYRFQTSWERAQLRTARSIVTVSHHFKNHLLSGGVDPDKVFVVPCAVDSGKFSFRQSMRSEIRERAGFSDTSVVGIYTGKFGGLYYDVEAFEIFATAFKIIADFKLIILTPDNLEVVRGKLTKAGIPVENFFLTHVAHDAVPDFLSASDFAFAMYKPSPSKRFLSPVKVGEYWASGLPVMLTEGVGDEGDIMISEGGGVTFRFGKNGSVGEALNFIEKMVAGSTRSKSYETISNLALKYRNFERVREVYESIFFTL